MAPSKYYPGDILTLKSDVNERRIILYLSPSKEEDETTHYVIKHFGNDEYPPSRIEEYSLDKYYEVFALCKRKCREVGFFSSRISVLKWNVERLRLKSREMICENEARKAGLSALCLAVASDRHDALSTLIFLLRSSFVVFSSRISILKWNVERSKYSRLLISGNE